MSLTLADGPLASHGPTTVNYSIEGPQHRLLLSPFPRRVRATFAGEVVLDSVRGQLVHESNLLPVLYVPREDVRGDLLKPTDHTTHCPFKGDAAYESVVVGEREAENALWHYPQPKPEASWLEGLVAAYFERLDAWFDEDEQIHAHLRDPYHRVDCRRTSRRVVVSVANEVLADSLRAVLLSETGLPNRLYVPPEDVRTDLLVPSTTRTHCPYKGDAEYWSLPRDGTTLTDVAWGYPAPFDGARAIAGHRCFAGNDVTIDLNDA